MGHVSESCSKEPLLSCCKTKNWLCSDQAARAASVGLSLAHHGAEVCGKNAASKPRRWESRPMRRAGSRSQGKKP